MQDVSNVFGGCECVVCMWGVCVVYICMCIGCVYVGCVYSGCDSAELCLGGVRVLCITWTEVHDQIYFLLAGLFMCLTGSLFLT